MTDETSDPTQRPEGDSPLPPAADVPVEADAEGAKARKERVLHTRVPAVLEQELKRLADSLRVPVSNVVRAILEDALDAVDVAGRRAEGEIRSVAERLAEERARLREPLLGKREDAGSTPAGESAGGASAIAGAVGFTPMVLASETRCAVRGDLLPAGSPAFLVLFAEPGRHAIVGPDVPPKAR